MERNCDWPDLTTTVSENNYLKISILKNQPQDFWNPVADFYIPIKAMRPPWGLFHDDLAGGIVCRNNIYAGRERHNADT